MNVTILITEKKQRYFHGKELVLFTHGRQVYTNSIFFMKQDEDAINFLRKLILKTGYFYVKLVVKITRNLQEELLTTDYSIIWCLYSQILNTLRHNGHSEMKSYLVDQSFFSIKEERSSQYWSYIYEKISDENREKMFHIIRSYLLGVATNLVNSVCKSFDRSKLDEAENSAFLMLLFTNPSSLSVISDQTKELLRKWKHDTLNGIAQHIERTGRDVHDRLGEIIFLITEFQVVYFVEIQLTKIEFRTYSLWRKTVSISYCHPRIIVLCPRSS